jgi:hypothetical protein
MYISSSQLRSHECKKQKIGTRKVEKNKPENRKKKQKKQTAGPRQRRDDFRRQTEPMGRACNAVICISICTLLCICICRRGPRLAVLTLTGLTLACPRRCAGRRSNPFSSRSIKLYRIPHEDQIVRIPKAVVPSVPLPRPLPPRKTLTPPSLRLAADPHPKSEPLPHLLEFTASRAAMPDMQPLVSDFVLKLKRR